MRIVIALPYAPWPVTRGTDRLIMNLLEGLAGRHEVTLATMTLGGAELERLREIERPGLSLRAIVAPHRRGQAQRVRHKARALAAALGGVPQAVTYAAPAQFLRLVAGAAREARADLVLANYWHLYRLPRYVDPARLVLVTHDLDFLVRPQRIALRRGLAARTAALQARLLARIELEAYRRFEMILTVNEADTKALESHPVAAGKRILTLPLAFDPAAGAPGAPRREAGTILLLGAFDSDFNSDALRWFLREIMPLVRQENPRARLEVVGRGVEERLRRSAPPGVVFMGGVEDVAGPLARCAVMVLPMRFCGGVRIRMLEAAAAGTPVVSTPAGVAGMGLAAGSEYLEAAGEREFAAAILALLGGGDEAQRLGANARRWAEENLSPQTYPARLDAVLEALTRPDDASG